MRISAIPSDPGFNEDATTREGLVIKCDGEVVPMAHTADTELGMVWFYYHDERRRIKTGTRQGKVEIIGL